MTRGTLKDSPRHFLSRLTGRADTIASQLPELQLRAERAATSIYSAEHNQRKTGTGEKFWQYREYIPGDRPQDIDWRQSAKGDRIFIRQKEWQTTQTALFWCQNNQSMAYSSDKNIPTKAEEAVTMSLALAMMATRAGEQIALLDGLIRAGRSEKTINELGQALCRPSEKALPASSIHDLPRNASLFLVGDFLSDPDKLYHALKPLHGYVSNAVLIQILDPAELTLPYSGHCVFREDEHAPKMPIANVASIRDEYIEKIEKHIESVQAVCRKLQYSYMLHESGTPLTATLGNIWAMMEGADKS